MTDSKTKLEKLSRMMRELWDECRGEEDFCFRCNLCSFCDEGLTPKEIADAIDDYTEASLSALLKSSSDGHCKFNLED